MGGVCSSYCRVGRVISWIGFQAFAFHRAAFVTNMTRAPVLEPPLMHALKSSLPPPFTEAPLGSVALLNDQCTLEYEYLYKQPMGLL